VRERGAAPAIAAEEVPQLAAAVTAPAAAAPAVPKVLDFDGLMELGATAYGTHCAACHQANGQGLAPAFPTLVGVESVVGAKAAHIDVVLNGVQGTAMASFAYLSDDEIAAILTYERNSWGNQAEMITPDEIAAAR